MVGKKPAQHTDQVPALDDVGYNGWLTDETGAGWPDLNKRFDLVIAGKDPGRRD
jgi:hypothetical protein